jgi:hypothetical protein
MDSFELGAVLIDWLDFGHLLVMILLPPWVSPTRSTSYIIASLTEASRSVSEYS